MSDNNQKSDSPQSTNLVVSIDHLLPETLFLVPIRGRPVFPGMVTPLVIAPGPLSQAVDVISKKTGYLGLVMQEDDQAEEIIAEKLYHTGTAVKILKKINLPEGGIHILVNTLQRFTIKEFVYTRPNVVAKVEYHPDVYDSRDKEIMALTRAVLAQAKEMMNESPFFTEEMKVTLVNVDEPGKIADFVCSILNLEKHEFQDILETFDVKRRLEKALVFITRELELLRLQKKIQGEIHRKIEEQQREFFLREQLKAIRQELGQRQGYQERNAEYYRTKIENLKLPAEAREKVLAEIDKLEYIDSNSAEFSVVRNYLDTIIDLPWEEPTFHEIDLNYARKVLNRDHFGLEDVKERILEFLAVRKLRHNEKGSILCLVGPPGAGKTSLGKSIAEAMQRKFYRFSLGGMRDEAEIKGHRRTYVGAMPGKIIQALRVVKSKNPVLMLDEIDKLGISFQGDPASALLEVLDPAQNTEFRDHYLDLPFDLSYIVFITTANTLDPVPEPLLDRMEIIRLAGYTPEEKVQIARRFIIPRTIKEFGLSKKEAPQLSTKVVRFIIDGYSREAGVRSLEKEIQKFYRKAAYAIVEHKPFPKEITEKELVEILGQPRFSIKDEIRIITYGVALGLAYTAWGGAALLVEANAMPGRGRFKLTGQLGKVMQESAEIALTYIRSYTSDAAYFQRHDIHLHVPDGATPKDGPSAGITIATALLSLYRKKKIKFGYAMTGELGLNGEVMPIGGLREKVIAARRVGIKHVILPKENEKDLNELPTSVKKGLVFHLVSEFHEVEKVVFGS
ncbi:MAG: endopeptidase La [Leptospiraceae bacterium]|nr:endopeptidase La [Leptospiraceae bacterium]MDW8305478.1 endopeptidase La [Leptospiraceae bacterium]